MKIRVHYRLPDAGSELFLRADSDWDRSLSPTRVDRSGERFEFDLPEDGLFRYFKPVIAPAAGGASGLHAAGVRWSQGDNYLAVRQGAPLDVYPYFDPDESCHVCDLHRVPSSFAERGYDVRVFVPPGYDENPLAAFPVLYMQDGQNLFFPKEAYGGVHWRVPETLAALQSMNLIRRVLVVGIYPVDRERDYTAPGYEEFGRFLVKELKPWVDERYRTRKGPEDTAVMGSSLGGVVSFFLGWRWPEVFGQVACLSSTFGYRDDLLERVGNEDRRPIRIYIDSGWPRDNYEATRSMFTALRERGYREGRNLLYLAFPDGRHSEESWAMRAHLPFQFLFRP